MKRYVAATAAVFTLFVGVFSANAFTIADNYFGGDPTHGWSPTDVIGDYNYYDTVGINISIVSKNMAVDIFSAFVAQVNSPTVRDDQTQLGDLFIGTGGWKPNGTLANHYDIDTNKASDASTKDNWDYVVVLSNHDPAKGPLTGGRVSIYKTADGSFVGSNIGNLDLNSWVYRENQIVQFTPNHGAISHGSGTWDIGTGFNSGGIQYGDLKINLDYSGIEAAGNEWAFNWSMTCANDVMQGETYVPAPVPEPGTLVLLCLGFIILVIRSKRIKNML